jgi:hypothetical protein
MKYTRVHGAVCMKYTASTELTVGPLKTKALSLAVSLLCIPRIDNRLGGRSQWIAEGIHWFRLYPG